MKKEGVEKYLFLGFIIVVLAVILVNKGIEDLTGFATVKDKGIPNYNEGEIIQFCYDQTLYDMYVRFVSSACGSKGDTKTTGCLKNALREKTPKAAYSALTKCKPRPESARICWDNLESLAKKTASTHCKFKFNKCGDGAIQHEVEECDDGNTNNGDGCSSICVREYCGDWITQSELGEECDDGNLMNNDRCNIKCKLDKCGDGLLQLGEKCDDGNTNNGDGCSSKCRLEYS